MIDQFLHKQIQKLAEEHRRFYLLRWSTWIWAAATLLVFLLWLAQREGYHLPRVVWFVPLLLAIAGMVVVRMRFPRKAVREKVQEIEQRHPELNALLLTAVQQEKPQGEKEWTLLQQKLLRQAMRDSQQALWNERVAPERFWTWRTVKFASFVLILFFVLASSTDRPEKAKSRRLFARPGLEILPGNTNLERGSSLPVIASFNRAPNTEVKLVIQKPGATPEEITMSQNLADPVFGYTLNHVREEFNYQVIYGTSKSPVYKVAVFERPRFVKADARIEYPTYTKLDPKEIKETRRVTALEGSKIQLAIELNKPVKVARLLSTNRPPLTLNTPTNRPMALLENHLLNDPGQYDLELVDREGRTNTARVQFVFEVQRNRRPDLKFVRPKGDQRVSALQEVNFRAEASDDFGLLQYGMAFNVVGQETNLLTMGKEIPANQKAQLQHLLKLEELKVKPDQLIAYHLWADDLGPDGKVRRSSSDIYFAEVRAFEEIYRQAQSGGDSGGSQGGGGEGPATKLAEIQKQIISATWKLQAKEDAASYNKDLGIIQNSQKAALSQLKALKERAEGNPRAATTLSEVETAMEKALDKLGNANKKRSELSPALDHEQAAYQGLLKMSSREFQVAQSSRSQSSGSSSSSRNQRQLDELDLKKEEKRYETQSVAAKTPNAKETAEQLILSQLREIAQRQQELNEKIKELQNQLQLAKTEQEKEELKRELKRLQEEQRDLLADLDEVQQKMDASQNSNEANSNPAERRQQQAQMEKTRSEMQKASQALDENSLADAASSATRAERQLQDLKENLKQKSSQRFKEEMRDLRNGARQLAQRQEEIGQKLREQQSSRRKSLAEESPTAQLGEEITRQKQSLTNLLGEMTRLSQATEATEPVVSRELYDTLRATAQAPIEQNMNMLQRLLDANFRGPASQTNQHIAAELNKLKEGVERAAEGVLGSEEEALRAARNELNDLAQELEQEVARASGRSSSTNRNTEGERMRARYGLDTASNQNQTNGNMRAAGGRGASTNMSASAQGEEGSQRQRGNQGQNPNSVEQQQSPTLAQAGQGNQPSPGQEGQSGQSQNSSRGQGQPGQQQQPGQGQGQGQGQSQEQAQASANSPQQGQGQSQGQGEGQGEGSSQALAQNNQRGNNQRGNRNQRGNQARNQQRNSGGGNNPSQQLTDQYSNSGGGGGGETYANGPLTGENYVQWSDRLRNVEDMLEDPNLRGDLSRIRERARAMRADFKRHSKTPQWDLVAKDINAPLYELRDKVAEELARKSKKDPLVPIDRDAVPQQFSELVKKYYEKLGE